jgi:tetratricopeptide (TPR) repeat protein
MCVSAVAVTLVPELQLDALNDVLVEEAEQALVAHDYARAVELLADAHSSRASRPRLALRALLAESWARMSLGELQPAVALLSRARALAEQADFDDVDRADVLFRLGCCRLNLSELANATSLLTLALELCDRSGRRCDALRARILDWRSRCYQRQRDLRAAHADVERGLELAGDDERLAAALYFQASIVAEREGQWLLARCYGEQALELHERSGDRLGVHKLLNNLGGIDFLLGEHERAVGCLKDSFRVALELGSDVGAAYAMSSLAQVQLHTGDLEQAERHALRALELLEGRDDHLAELGNAQLVLARTLAAGGRYDEAERALDRADASFGRFGSPGHSATAWVARGELAELRADLAAAAALYRRAVDALQDVHF